MRGLRNFRLQDFRGGVACELILGPVMPMPERDDLQSGTVEPEREADDLSCLGWFGMRSEAAPPPPGSPAGTGTETEAQARYGLWDRDSIETLTRIYETGAPCGGPMRDGESSSARLLAPLVGPEGKLAHAPPLCDPVVTRLERIAASIERSLAAGSVSAAADTDRRFDELERRITATVETATAGASTGALRLVEAHVADVAERLEDAKQDLARLDAIEVLLHGLAARLGEDRLAALEARAGGTAAHAPAFALTSRRLDRLSDLVQGFIEEHRQDARRMAGVLEQLHGAMTRVLHGIETRTACLAAEEQAQAGAGGERVTRAGKAAANASRGQRGNSESRRSPQGVGPRGKLLALVVTGVLAGHTAALSFANLSSNDLPALALGIGGPEPGESQRFDSRSADWPPRELLSTGALDEARALASVFISEPIITSASPAEPLVTGTSTHALSPGLAGRGHAVDEFETAARLAALGDEQSLSAALFWYERAASRGFAPAQYRAASFRERGIGAAADPMLARAWYVRAADQGHARAMHNLGVLSARGENGTPDWELAARRFTEAAKQGLADSQFNLALLHEAGLGVPKSLPAAYVWFARAAAGGDGEAALRRDALRLRLDPSAVTVTAGAAKRWRASAAADNAEDGNPDEM